MNPNITPRDRLALEDALIAWRNVLRAQLLKSNRLMSGETVTAHSRLCWR